MNIDEMKLKMKNFVNNTIDLYFPPTNFFDKLKNATAKLWVEQNTWRLHKILEAFADEYHEIDGDKVIEMYEHILFENGELKLNVKEMIPENMTWINDFLPNKIIIFKKEDLYDIVH